MSRFARWLPASGLLVATFAFAPLPQDYHIVARLSSIMDGQPLVAMRFDATSHRLFAVNSVGVYSADLSSAKPKMTGPITGKPKIVNSLDVAPDLGRVFYAALDEVGYVDEKGGPPVTMSTGTAWSIAYEPTKQEVYAAYGRSADVEVYDARTGKRTALIKLPGWNGFGLQAIAGTVFLFSGGEDGIFAIDATTHAVARWPVTGSLITPGNLEADPSGHYLFLARSREIDAIDIPTRTVIGREPMFGTASIAFDPSSGLLVATWPDLSETKDKLEVLHPGADGLTTVATLKNDAGGTVIVRTNYGFIQRADRELLVWAAQSKAGH
jgi:DNA-binding beta-propeller fold protein YncE